MRYASLLLCALFLLTQASIAASQQVITIRTGQVAPGQPGTCPALDYQFHYYAPNDSCGGPLRRHGLFQGSDFMAACSGPRAALVNFPGNPPLPSDPLARWINWSQSGCYPTARSVLYCAPFRVDCVGADSVLADSIRVCWRVDDGLGDPSSGPYAGPNHDGVYINGVSLGPQFFGYEPYGKVAYNKWLKRGTNHFEAYQRDEGCSISGLILSATIYVHQGGGVIFGAKYNDQNCDGMYNGTDYGLPGWTINLSGPVNRSTTTDNYGGYMFSGLLPGLYTLHETTKPGWIECAPSGNTGGTFTLPIDSLHCSYDGATNFGNSLCQDSCSSPPACLQSWYPFDEGSGAVAKDVAANRDLTFISPAWTADPCQVNQFAADLTSPSPLRYLSASSSFPQHNFGRGSFAIFGWIKMRNPNDGLIHTLVDKRVWVGPNPKGYLIFVVGGALRLQLSGGQGGFRTYTGPVVPSNQWCFVGVNVCRVPGNPTDNTATLYVDNISIIYYNGSTPPVYDEDLQNSAALRVGEQCPGFSTGTAFGGAVDNLQFYKCCLTGVQVRALYDHRCNPCKWSVYAPSISTGIDWGAAEWVLVPIRICNYGNTSCDFKWTIAGLPAGGPYSVPGPTVYSSYSGTVTISPFPSCREVWIGIALPSGMSNSDLAGYQVTVKNMCDGTCKSVTGEIQSSDWGWEPWPAATLVLPDTLLEQGGFGVRNHLGGTQTLHWRLSARSGDGDPDNQVVSLNGLPPGTPVTGTLTLAPGDSGSVPVGISMTETQCLNINEVVLEMDVDGSGHYRPQTVLSLESVTSDQAASVDRGAPPAAAEGMKEGRISVAPNPFVGRTEVRFNLTTAQPWVRVGVFDVGGRLVREVHNGALAAGEHRITWDGLGADGQRMGGGIYFIRVQTAGELLKSKVVRME